jgi:hypothetical protein
VQAWNDLSLNAASTWRDRCRYRNRVRRALFVPDSINELPSWKILRIERMRRDWSFGLNSKSAAIAGLALVAAISQATAAGAPKSVACTYMQGQELTFDVPKKLGGLPPIEFDYPSKVTRFSFRDGNLLLVAMDESDESRVRIVISAQRAKGKANYDGQILVDMGGNQLQLDNGPVVCKAKG